MLFVNKLKVLILMTCLMLVGQGFAACVQNSNNAVWDGSAKEEPCLVNGYYEINTAAKLAWYGANYNSGNAKLTADLDLGGHLWIPLAAGKGDKYYSKIFDGQNHIIKNLYVNGDELSAINKEYAQNLGFVGVLGDGKVLNLVLENVDIQATTNAGTIISNQDNQISVGAVVGWMSDKGTNVVDNCIASGTIKTTGKSQGVGGIVGNAKNGTISNCMSLVEIQTSGSKAYVGGIIGIIKTDVTVSSCVYAGPGLTNTGSNGAVGGIAGNVWSGKLDAENSYYEGVFYYDGQEVSGVGKTCKDCDVTDNTHSTSEVNDEEIACALNGKNEDKTCKTEPWSTGSTVLSLNGYGPDGYKITFDANDGAFADGTVAKNKFLAKGLAITADEIGNPSRDQYSFVGWAFTQDATESDDLGFVSQRDTVFAVWEKKIKVTFDANGRTFLDGSEAKDVYVKKGDPITVDGLGSLPFTYCKEYSNTNPSQCLLTEYFTGWMDNAGTTIDFNNHDVLATVDVTYKAIWTDVRTYSVTFHANNNTTVDIVVYVDDGETLTSKPDDPTMEGYVFAGWYDGETVFNFGSEIETSKDLYAHWTPEQYNVTYVLGEGGKDKGDNPVVFTLGEGLLALNAPTVQDGYVSEGWFYDSEFKQKATAIDRDVVGDKTFYAKFSKKKYRVMYLADNNSYGSTSDIFVEHGSTINLESAGIFRRAGYEQNGWSTTMAGTKNYDLGEEVVVVAPITLYPTWAVATYTITYECDGCVNNPQNPTTYTINDKKDIKYPQSREGYDFGGWYKETSYTTKVTQIAKGSYGNITLYGKWIKVYTLTYELNGGTKANSRTSYTSETETFALGEAEGRDGYSFVGWYDNPDFEGDAVTEVPLGSSGDKTFYAKWTPEEYTATYDLAGGSMDGDNSFTFTIESEDITLATPSKDGYTFDGWLDSKTGDVITTFSHGSFGARTLTAQWTLTPALITVAAVTQEFEYDGNAHSTTCEVTSENPWGFTITASSTESVETVAEGSVEATCGNVVIMDGEDDVTASFASYIEIVPGTISVKAKEVKYGSVTISTDENGSTAVLDDNLKETVSIPVQDNVVVNSITFNRTFPVNETSSDKKYSTVVFPFSIAKSKVVGADFFELKDVDVAERKVVFWSTENSDKSEFILQANTPYIVRTTAENITFNLDGESVSLNTDEMHYSKSFNELWEFRGTYSSYKWKEGDSEIGRAYAFRANSTNPEAIGSFAKIVEGGSIRPFRAYLLNVPSRSQARSYRLAKSYSSVNPTTVDGSDMPGSMDVVVVDRETEETTIIGKLNTATGEIRMIDGWFDMKGRKLEAKPTIKGIYYFNGKQVIVQ